MINVAVLLATFNGAEFLESQLIGIMAQKYCKVTIFAADDASTDETVNILKKYNVVILDVSKVGSSSANFFRLINEFCLRGSIERYDYVALSDQDDIWFPDKLHSAVFRLKDNFDCYSGSFFADSRIPKSNPGAVSHVCKYFKQTKFSHIFRSPGPGFTFVFTRQALKKIASNAFFQNSFPIGNMPYRWHDWTLFAIAKAADLSWYIDPNGYALYRLHQNNDTGLRSYKNIFGRLKFLLNGSFMNEAKKMSMICGDKEIEKRITRLNMVDRFYFLVRIHLLRSKLTDRVALAFCILFSKRPL